MNNLFPFGQEEDGLCSRHGMLYRKEVVIDDERIALEYCPVCYRFRTSSWRDLPFDLNGRLINLLESLNSYIPQGRYFQNMSVRTFPLGRDQRKLCSVHQTEGIVRGAVETKEFCPDCELKAYEQRKRLEGPRIQTLRRTSRGGRLLRLKASVCKACRRTMIVRGGEFVCPECARLEVRTAEVQMVRTDLAIEIAANRARGEEGRQW